MDIPVYKIDSAVPMPTDERGEYGSLPINRLEVGESFVFPMELRSTIQSRASVLKKTNGKEFTVRKIDETSARIWRKA